MRAQPCHRPKIERIRRIAKQLRKAMEPPLPSGVHNGLRSPEHKSALAAPADILRPARPRPIGPDRPF